MCVNCNEHNRLQNANTQKPNLCTKAKIVCTIFLKKGGGGKLGEGRGQMKFNVGMSDKILIVNFDNTCIQLHAFEVH